MALPVNYFLLGCELFKEFCTDPVHVLSAEYLFFGVFDHGMLVPYIWGGLLLGMIAMVIFWIPSLYKRPAWMLAAATMCIVGVWNLGVRCSAEREACVNGVVISNFRVLDREISKN